MSRKKISTTIYVTQEQSDKLKLLHERTKVPVAVYIREGIDLVLRHYGHLLPGQLPLDAGPRATLERDRPYEGRGRDTDRDLELGSAASEPANANAASGGKK